MYKHCIKRLVSYCFMKHHDFSILGGHLAMNFYLFENDSRHTTTIRDLIEADFNNNLVGIGVS